MALGNFGSGFVGISGDEFMVDTTSRLELLPAQRGLSIPKEVERTVVLTHRISRVPEGDRFGLFHESRRRLARVDDAGR